MKKNNATVLKDKSKDLEAAFKSLISQEVLVGIPQEKDARKGEKIGNAVIGYLAENGSPVNNLPARPWREPGVRAVQSKVEAILKKAGQNAIDGRLEEVQKGLYAAGLVVQSSMRAVVTAGIPPKLADSTLARRKAQGFKGETPYIRSGAFYRAISFIVRNKNAKS